MMVGTVVVGFTAFVSLGVMAALFQFLSLPTGKEDGRSASRRELDALIIIAISVAMVGCTVLALASGL